MNEPLQQPELENGKAEASYVVPGLNAGCGFSPNSRRASVLGAPGIVEAARHSAHDGISSAADARIARLSSARTRIATTARHRRAAARLRIPEPLELTDLGLPVIESLRDATGFTTHIVIRDGRDVVFVAKAQSQAPVFSSIRVNVGTRLPAMRRRTATC